MLPICQHASVHAMIGTDAIVDAVERVNCVDDWVRGYTVKAPRYSQGAEAVKWAVTQA